MKNNLSHKSKNLILLPLLLLLLSKCNEPKSQSDKFGEMTQQYVIARIYILPTLDFNQFCPHPDLIPILEPGNHSIYLEEGNSYIFDNRARLELPNSIEYRSKFFTFTFQENPGQNVKVVSPYCGLEPNSYPAQDDSGLEGQLENIYINHYSKFNNSRYGFYTKFLAIKGSGALNFTTPSTFDPPR